MTPLIIPSFNQPTYTRNLVNWWKWYRPDDLVVIVDNASDSPELLEWFDRAPRGVRVERCKENRLKENLKGFLDAEIRGKYPYYAISDPDVMPHPATPLDFLEFFVHCVEALGYHHVGFGLIWEDIPTWVPPAIREEALRNEAPLHAEGRAVQIPWKGGVVKGFKSPIDTTFAVYASANSGWESPMPPAGWDRSLRAFKAFHLGFYIPEHPNAEMDHYFQRCRIRGDGGPPSGRNTYHPSKYNERPLSPGGAAV